MNKIANRIPYMLSRGLYAYTFYVIHIHIYIYIYIYITGVVFYYCISFSYYYSVYIVHEKVDMKLY